MTDTGQTPHSEEPAEGSTDSDGVDESSGGAIQGHADDDQSTGGAIQGDAGPHRDSPLGGDEHTEGQLQADNEVEEDTLKTLDPDNPA